MGMELISQIIHSFASITGILVNSLLIYLILTKTPKTLQTYAILLLNFALIDLVTCVTSGFIMQRLIPSGLSLAYISYGPCTFFGPSTCYVAYCVMLHSYAHGLLSLPISFGYRLYVLHRPVPRKRTVALLVLFVYSFSVLQMVSFIFAQTDPEQMRVILKRQHPSYDLTGKTVSGNANVLEFWTLFTILYMTLPWTPVYSLILYLRRKVNLALSDHTLSLSQSTRQTHRLLVKALTIQAALPLLFGAAVLSFAIGVFGIFQHPLLEEFTFEVVEFLPVCSPMLTLYFVGPYRRALTQKLSCILPRRMRNKSYSITTTSRIAPTNVSGTVW